MKKKNKAGGFNFKTITTLQRSRYGHKTDKQVNGIELRVQKQTLTHVAN